MAFIKSENVHKITPSPKTTTATKKPALVVIKKPADSTTGLVKTSVTTITSTLPKKSSSKFLGPIKSEKFIKTPITISKVNSSILQKSIKNPSTPNQQLPISKTLICNKTSKPSTKPDIKSSKIFNTSSNVKPSVSVKSTTKTKITIPSSTEKTSSSLKSTVKKVVSPIKSTSSPLKASSPTVSSPSKYSSKPTSKLAISPKSPSKSTLLSDIQLLEENTQLSSTKEIKSTNVIAKSFFNKTGSKSVVNSTLKPIELRNTVVSEHVSKTGINLELEISEVQNYSIQNFEKISLEPRKTELCRCIEPRCLNVSFNNCESPDPNFDIFQAYKLALKLFYFQENENLFTNWPQDSTLKFKDEIPSWSNQNKTLLRSTCKSGNSDGILQITEIPGSFYDYKFDDVTKLTNCKSAEITDSNKLIVNSTPDSVNASALNFSPNKCKSLCITYAQESEIENHVEYQTNIQELFQNNFSPLQITPVNCPYECLTDAIVSKKIPEVDLTPKQPLTPVFNLQKEYQMMKKVENLYTTNIYFPKIDNNVDRPDIIYDNESDEIKQELVRKKPYKKFKQFSFSKRYLRNIRRDFDNRNFEDAYDYTNIFIAPVWKNIH